MRTKVLALLFAAFAPFGAIAQTTPEEVMADLNKAGGVYFAYPVSESQNTPAPKGYKPFYISHYGRHGSRYLISDNDYTRMADLFHAADKANALTPLGKDVMTRIDSVLVEARGKGGDLSPLGVRQHRGIAERMYRAFPEVFPDNAPVDARSTVVMRCAMSMDAFCERLKELNPTLKTTREASERNMHYLNYHSKESNAYTSTEWKEEYRKFEERHTNGDRLVSTLFSDPAFIEKNVNPHDFMWGMYWLAVGMQDIETDLSFMDIFTPQELFDLWQCFNYRFYACDSNYPGNRGLVLANCRPLLNNIIVSADEAIAAAENGETPGATLRFGHDGNLIPLAGILRFKDCYNQEWNPADFYKSFTDFKIAPMAGNVQIVFFRSKDPKKPVLVKFMLNERETEIPVKTDIFPFYKWDDVRQYYIEQENL